MDILLCIITTTRELIGHDKDVVVCFTTPNGQSHPQSNENRQSCERNHDLDLTRHHDQKKWLDECLD